MKTLFRTSLAAGLLFTSLTAAHAQAVPNGGFETWAVRNGVESPTGWLTIDDVLAADPLRSSCSRIRRAPLPKSPMCTAAPLPCGSKPRR